MTNSHPDLEGAGTPSALISKGVYKLRPAPHSAPRTRTVNKANTLLVSTNITVSFHERERTLTILLCDSSMCRDQYSRFKS